MKKLRILILIFCLFVPCIFVACDNDNQPVCSTPTGLNVQSGGIITFQYNDPNDYYIISIDDINVPVIPRTNSYVELYTQGGANYLEYDASKIINLGQSYSIKVQALQDGKKASEYTSTVSYTHTLPIATPENVQINNLTLTWDTVQNSSMYKVKVLTPNDRIDADDSETVANADLPTYQFSINRFEFESILTVVGSYKFYISAVSLDRNYTASDYTVKVEYVHKRVLDTPSGLSVHKVDGELHLVAVRDINANALTINSNKDSKTIELGAEHFAIQEEDNIIDINLNRLFDKSYDDFAQYEFSCQAKSATGEMESYYLDSAVSSAVYYNNYEQITKPTLSVAYDTLNSVNIATWAVPELELSHVAGFVLYSYKEHGVVIETLRSTDLSRVLTDDVYAIAVQAIGVGGYINSVLSDTVSRFEEAGEELSINVDGSSILSWNTVASYYLVEIGSHVIETQDTSLDLASLDLKPDKYTIRVIAAVDGCIPMIDETEINIVRRLGTPVNVQFTSSNAYLVRFSAVEHAIGYALYLNGEKVDRVFATTEIDISRYVIKEGIYNSYTVQIQALADKYSGYQDSELSSDDVTVSHTPVLDTPEFKKNQYGEDDPVVKIAGDITSYYLYFKGVDYAFEYEVMINFHKKTVLNDNRSGYYEVNITDYVSSANSYTITVRAIPNTASQTVIKPSEKNVYEYELRLQLQQVTNIEVDVSEDEEYTLSFDIQNNAKEYSVHIVKVNDMNYDNYLAGKGLRNNFVVPGAYDITPYVKEKGLYQIYVTALADKSGGFYADSDESIEYAEINKLDSLTTPQVTGFENKSEDSYILHWNGDAHADYYVIRVTDPAGRTKEYKTADNTNKYNINESLSVEGTYQVRIKAMVETNSNNAKTYVSSSYCNLVSHKYNYTHDYDFRRYAVFMNGNMYDYYIEDVEDLMYILWRHVLYGVEPEGLKVYIKAQTGETITGALSRFATEAEIANLYKFSVDAEWTEAIGGGQGAMFDYIVDTLLSLYPEYAVVDNVQSVTEHVNDDPIFHIAYNNRLTSNKVDADAAYIKFNTDYGNKFDYLSGTSRRNEASTFSIDKKDAIDVTTTEQLLMAVQYGKKPNFIGDSEAAEIVYNNARNVLRTIANNSMSDYEKTVAIFDWISYAVNLNTAARNKTGVDVTTLVDYGMRKDFYLEGVFLSLHDKNVGGYDGEFYLGKVTGTDESYAKAFVLLCGIEGINAVKVNGLYNSTTAHTWNKVALDLDEDIAGKEWYALDFTFSDNNLTYNFGMASHSYFLQTDQYLNDYLGLYEKSAQMTAKATTVYDYYANEKFGLTKNELTQALKSSQSRETDGFEYFKKYNASATYQQYPDAKYSGLQAFLTNLIIDASYQLNFVNSSKLATYEFKISKAYTNNQLSLPQGVNNDGLINIVNNNLAVRQSNGVTATNLIPIDDGYGNVTFICTIKQS